jgi:hypothetical protein
LVTCDGGDEREELRLSVLRRCIRVAICCEPAASESWGLASPWITFRLMANPSSRKRGKSGKDEFAARELADCGN